MKNYIVVKKLFLLPLILFLFSCATLNESAKVSEYSPLYIAAEKGDLAKVKERIASGADVNTKGSYGMSALQAAANGQHAKVVHALLKARANPNITGGLLDETPLKMAATYGYEAIVKSLIAAGAKVDTPDNAGVTALGMAANKARPGTVKILLAAGADSKTTDRFGRTALFLAVGGGNSEIVAMLLAVGAQANVATNDGLSPLMLATAKGNLEAMRHLLANGAEVNAIMKNTRKKTTVTATDIAVERKQQKAQELLKGHGGKSALNL